MSDISGNIRSMPAKAPGATLDYSLDLSGWLAQAQTTDTLASVSLTSITPSANPGDLTNPTPPTIVVVGSAISIWLTGGVDGTEYAVELQVTSAGSRSDTFVILIGVLDPLAAVADRIGPDMASYA